MANVAQAGKAIGSSVGNLVGGLFHKKKTDDSQAAASAAAPSDATAAAGAAPATATNAAGAADPYAQYVQMAAFTTETTAITTDAVPADRFDIPPDWKKDVPKASKRGDDEFTCPKAGAE